MWKALKSICPSFEQYIQALNNYLSSLNPIKISEFTKFAIS